MAANNSVSFNDRIQAIKLAIKWTYESSSFLTVTILLVSIFGGLIVIIEPYMLKLLIDYLLGNNSLTASQKIGFGIVGILFLYALAKILQNAFWDISNLIKRVHTLRIEQHSVHSMMKNISSLDVVYFEDPNYYNKLSRANQNLYRILELFWTFTFLIGELVSIIIIALALLSYDYKILGFILLGAIPSIIFSVKTTELMWSAFSFSSPLFRHARYYQGLLTERPEAIKEIRSFGLREHFLKKFRDLFKKYIIKQDKAALSQLAWYFVIAVVEGGLSVAAAYLVILLYIKGGITIGTLTFLWGILFQFASHMRWLVRLIGDINSHATFLTPVVEVLRFKPVVEESKNPKQFPSKIKKGIEFRNVTFYYPGTKKPSLKNVNLFIKPAESIALVGENGSGKTTLIKLLCRLYDVTKGEILIDGVNIKEYSLKDLYENIGVIFQDFMKYEALLEENIGFGKLEESKKKQKIHKAAIKSGAWRFIKNLEKKYKTHLGKTLKEGGIDLSIGQWQKIALARAFFRDSQILILDEPTAAVDAKAEYELFKKFEKLTKNKTTLLISHRFSTVRMADKIVVIDKAKIKEAGSHKELLNKNGVYAKLFSLQAKGYA